MASNNDEISRPKQSNIFSNLCKIYLLGNTVVFAFLTRIIFAPSLFSFLVAWPASELVHFLSFFQASNLFLLNWVNPTLFDGRFSKFLLVINFFCFYKQFRALKELLHSKEDFNAALKTANIVPKSGKSSLLFLASLLPLPIIGRRWKKLTKQSYDYSHLSQLDAELIQTWHKMPKNLKKVHVYLGRDNFMNWLSLDVLGCSNPPPPPGSPILCYIHGGGWGTGSKMFAANGILNRIASRQVVVVSINYRLAPERAFPTQIIDCKRALIYIKRNCQKWNGDPNKIFVCGESAGGHLAALLAVTCNKPIYQPLEDAYADTSVAGAIPLYGVLDWSDQDGHLYQLHPPLLEGLQGSLHSYLERVVMQKSYETNRIDYELASPTYHLRKALETNQNPHLCPFMIVHGSRDALAAFLDSKTFYNELKKVRRQFGEDVLDIFCPVTGGHHAFGYIVSPRAMALGDAICDFINHFVHKSELID